MKSFRENLRKLSISLERKELDTVQINVGKLCNQSCLHCHVDAGPNRREIMTRDTIDRVISFVKDSRVKTVDITGGAPELNPHFKFLISSLRRLNCRIMVRSNLTVIVENDKEHFSQFFKDNKVELICSLPCYSEKNVDDIRGQGVYIKSIKALEILNSIGYGKDDSNFKLHLVYNPAGASLPPLQKELERQYKQELLNSFGIVFNNLYVVTNIPINRYEKYLKKIEKYEYYLELLKENFNINVLEKLMCRTQVSVGWDGKLYDCDFNQMLNLYLKNGKPYMVGEVALQELISADIRTGDHCYGCTAGSGSSCGGSLVQ